MTLILNCWAVDFDCGQNRKSLIIAEMEALRY
jgi:hypothetical protein